MKIFSNFRDPETDPYLSFIKELNIPIMLITNSEFDSSLIKKVDYILYDSNNTDTSYSSIETKIRSAFALEIKC